MAAVLGVVPVTPIVSDLQYEGSTQYPIIYDDDVVAQTLDLLFGVTPGERFLLEGYGIDLEKYVFEYNDDTLEHVIISEVVSQLQMFAPFIEIVWPASKVEQKDNYIDIRITFKLSGSNDLKSYNRFFQSVG